MYAGHDMTELGKGCKSITVHYGDFSQWVKVRGGKVVKHSEGAELHILHALSEWERIQGLARAGMVD